MKITKVETIVLNLPMVIEGAVVPTQAGRPRTSMDILLVRVDTDAGVTGWGEGFGHRIFPATRAALDTLVGPMCVGRDPTAFGVLMDELQRNLAGVGRNGPAMYALSAIDIALWDISGKLAGQPLYRLLGGSPPTRVCCATGSPVRSSITSAKRSSAATATSSCTRSRCRRSRPRAMPPAPACPSWWIATVRGRSPRRSTWRAS